MEARVIGVATRIFRRIVFRSALRDYLCVLLVARVAWSTRIDRVLSGGLISGAALSWLRSQGLGVEIIRIGGFGYLQVYGLVFVMLSIRRVFIRPFTSLLGRYATFLHGTFVFRYC